MIETYYTLLGLDKDATDEEIKNKYQVLIKLYHPDKQKCDTAEEFIKINDAWNVLRDENKRKEYDSNLLQYELKENSLIYAELNLNEINFENDMCNYPCRCGDSFLIKQSEINESCIMECAECSNCISIKFS